MKKVQMGSAVNLHYKGTFSNGEIFDDSRARGQTIQVLVGNGVLLKGFESALLGMTEGEVKTVSLSSEEAYGPIKEEAFAVIKETAKRFNNNSVENLASIGIPEYKKSSGLKSLPISKTIRAPLLF